MAGATIALHLGGTEVARRPVAILDFYGPKLFGHEFWTQPLGVFAQVPRLPQEFLDKVF